jgi:hypothetical protein
MNGKRHLPLSGKALAAGEELVIFPAETRG